MRIGSSEGVHCFYQNSNNDKQVVSGFSTKFEPCFARTFLPGWDEPRIRSTFNVSIQHFSDVVVLTNTAPIKDKIAKNVESPKQSNSMMEKITRTIVISQFEPTPAMPLYLLSFAMGNNNNISVIFYISKNLNSSLNLLFRTICSHWTSQHYELPLENLEFPFWHVQFTVCSKFFTHYVWQNTKGFWGWILKHLKHIRIMLFTYIF